MIFAQTPPYKNSSLPVEERVNDLLGRLTLEEKIDLLGGTGFATKPIERLGIPELRMSDGPLGVRWDQATAFPAGTAMAATWNPRLVRKLGVALGRETKGKARHVILGPGVNIARLPMNGRNFEYLGEDPFLTSQLTVEYIKGVQSEGVAATIKHFAANNQEHERDFVDTEVSERALNEIYFPHFKASVQEADVLCVMCSYNKVNGFWASENDYLMIDRLKKNWGFTGLVMSDWGAVHHSLPVAKGGLDLEMPDGKYLNQKTLLDEIKNGNVPLETINDKVTRILRVIFKLGLFDQPEWKEDPSLVNTKENRDIAYETAKEGIVLLKNVAHPAISGEKNILPLSSDKIKSIAVIGPNAAIARTGGGGSSMVSPYDPVSALDGLKNKIGDKIEINYSPGLFLDTDVLPIGENNLFVDADGKQKGLQAEYFTNKNLEGEPALKRIDGKVNFDWGGDKPASEIDDDNFSVRWTGYIKAVKSGKFTINASSDDGVRLWINDKQVIDDWTDHAIVTNSADVEMEEGKFYKVKLEYYENGGGAVCVLGWRLPDIDPLIAAIETAKKSDAAIIFAGNSYTIESEGFDRKDLFLPGNQDDLIKKICEVNPNTIVVLLAGAPVVMNEWIDKVKGIVQAWFPGTEGGNAIADVLLGNYNPSGKLPMTFPKKWEDCSAFNSYHKEDGRTVYDDDIFVGYRHFDKYNIEPLFPFGFGLSYTTFGYDTLKVEKIAGDKFEASFTITNTGKVDGAEIAQLYISQVNPVIEKAPKELKGFDKVELKAGESKTVKITIGKNDFAYFDEDTKDWKVDSGKYQIIIGASSRDIKLTQTVEL